MTIGIRCCRLSGFTQSLSVALAVATAAASGCAEPSVDEHELAPPPEGTGFQLVEGSFTVDPGREADYCMRLPIPEEYGDAPVFIRGFESRLPVPTHHFGMSYVAEPVGQPEPCSPAGALTYYDDSEDLASGHARTEGKLVFAAGVGDYDLWLPDGYGIHLSTGAGRFETTHHVLNLSDAPADMFGVFNVYTGGVDEVHHPVSSLACLLQDIWVAPNSEATVTATCVAPFDLDLVILGSHAHQYLRRFETRIFDGVDTLPEPIYASDDWDSPEIVALDEPLRLNAGQGLTFSCHYVNPTDEPLVFGTGTYGEMCATVNAYAYTSDRPHDVPSSLGIIIFREGESAELIDTTDLDGMF